MPELGKSGSVGALGEKSPGATRLDKLIVSIAVESGLFYLSLTGQQ